jgi:hypothetical protein
MPQDQQDILSKERAFNILRNLIGAHACTIYLPLRRSYGSEALGWKGLLACLLLLVMAGDNPIMGWYFILWLVVLVLRRIECFIRRDYVHSLYDGYPCVAMMFPGVRRESTAKYIIEPALSLILGIVLAAMAEAYETPWLETLSAWMFLGFFTLAFDYGIYDAVQRRRVRAMRDARIQQEDLMQRFHDSF